MSPRDDRVREGAVGVAGGQCAAALSATSEVSLDALQHDCRQRSNVFLAEKRVFVALHSVTGCNDSLFLLGKE